MWCDTCEHDHYGKCPWVIVQDLRQKLAIKTDNHDKDGKALVRAYKEIDKLRDELADYQHNVLAKFDPKAAESTDLYTWIKCLLAENERMKNRMHTLEEHIQELQQGK